jgi:hypothetical protein
MALCVEISLIRLSIAVINFILWVKYYNDEHQALRTWRGSERDIFTHHFFAGKREKARKIIGGQPLKELRLNGRGDQGSVTKAEIIAFAAFEDDRFS